MSNPPPHPLVERFTWLFRCLTLAIVTQGIIGRIASPVVARLTDRFRTLTHTFARLVARVQAGTYRPRRSGPRRVPVSRKPPGESPPWQKFGWLATLLPDAAQQRGHLHHLLHQPDMAALIEAAPVAMARALRPLYWALRLQPPPFLPAAPRRPQAAAPAPAPSAASAPPRAAIPPAAPIFQPPRSGNRQRGTSGPPRPA